MALAPLAKLHIGSLLQLNDKLRKLAVHESDINVSSIVAVGDQSHGKTSLIEAIGGIELPRGEGIQTRVPLVIFLKKLTSTDPGLAQEGQEEGEVDLAGEYALIKAKGIEEKRIQLSEIAAEVRHCTDLLTGEGQNGIDIVDTELELTVFRYGQLEDLTLIDLPGMTRVAMEGQHKDIEATITRMYERYMKPTETIVLNIVSAMVDFSTSKSLQMSRELDPLSERTMLCVTKVDQHTDPGLFAKIESAGTKMGLPLEHIFCVRNRSQPENENGIALDEARRKEASFFDDHNELCNLPDYSKGVHALSLKLVKLQVERIRATLPRAAITIKQRTAELQDELRSMGTVVDSELSGRMLVQERLMAGMRTLHDEFEGRSRTLGTEESEVAGEVLELSLDIPDLKSLRKTCKFGNKGQIDGPKVPSLGNMSFFLTCYPRSNAEIVEKEGEPESVGIFVSYVSSSRTSAQCEYSIQAYDESDKLINENPMNKDTFITAAPGFGKRQFISAEKADSLSAVRFQATVFVNSLTRTSDNKQAEQMLCAEIFDEDTAMCDKVHRLYPNYYFFSDGLRKIIERETKARQGGSGLPGAILPEPSIAVLAKLRSKLPAVVSAYVNTVAAVTQTRCENVLTPLFEDFPTLLSLVQSAVVSFFDTAKAKALAMTANILEWEDTLHTQNHYFMDTVQQLRKLLLKQDDESESEKEELPEQFQFLAKQVGKLQGLSNEQQRLLDLQIEIFAYWKTMKKRLIDYVQLATRNILVKRPVEHELTHVLQEQIERESCRGGLLALMAPDKIRQIKIKKAKVRLEALRQAQVVLDEAMNRGTFKTGWEN